MLKGWGDAVWPDELVDVEGASARHGALVRYLVLDDKHLVTIITVQRASRSRSGKRTCLTDIRYLKHLLVVQGLLRLDQAGKIH